MVFWSCLYATLVNEQAGIGNPDINQCGIWEVICR